MITISKYYPFILGIFHLIGIALFIVDPKAADLSYLVLLLSGTLLLLSENITAKKAIVYFSIFCFGYLIELVGTKTGYLFGTYQYDNALGYKWAGVPVIIGLNWLIIVIASVSVIRKLKVEHHIICAFLAALLCTFMDVIIEPVATSYNMWSWNDAIIPVYNYVCWFIFSLFFALLYIKNSKKHNPTGVALYLIWVLFFLILNFI